MFDRLERPGLALKGWREPLSNSPPGRGPASVRQSKTRLLGLLSANRLRNRKLFGNKPPPGIRMYLWQFAAFSLEACVRVEVVQRSGGRKGWCKTSLFSAFCLCFSRAEP